jgi:hypothetical protein
MASFVEAGPVPACPVALFRNTLSTIAPMYRDLHRVRPACLGRPVAYREAKADRTPGDPYV